MKILMLVNWKVKYCEEKPIDKQPPDYYVYGEDYWFYRYFKNKPQVDVVDISTTPWLEKFGKNKIRFYIWQTLRILPKLSKYDLIVSHGMQSGVVLSLWRRVFKTKAKHIIFDIGSFNSAAESGFALKLMQYASKSLDGVIYHTSSQINYYRAYFPWIVKKSKFIRFGTDMDFFDTEAIQETKDKNKYIICVGYSKRDWSTVVEAYQGINTEVKLRLIGHIDDRYSHIKGVEQLPYIPINQLINQVSNARFSVLPLESFNYSYGQMTLMQEMALGQCVVAAKVPSLIDYIEDGKTAIMYEPQNVTELRNKMLKLLQGEIDTNKISKEAIIFLKEKCNEVIMASEIEQQFYLF